MKLHKYRSYRQYRRLQSKKNRKRIDTVWANPDVIQAIADYVKQHIPDAKFGICHGAKHGWEVKELKDQLGFDILGTDISKTAKEFEDVIQWDFHEVKDEWRAAVDFIYSNSFDHTYDPDLCIDRWMSCIRPPGACFVDLEMTINNLKEAGSWLVDVLPKVPATIAAITAIIAMF